MGARVAVNTRKPNLNDLWQCLSIIIMKPKPILPSTTDTGSVFVEFLFSMSVFCSTCSTCVELNLIETKTNWNVVKYTFIQFLAELLTSLLLSWMSQFQMRQLNPSLSKKKWLIMHLMVVHDACVHLALWCFHPVKTFQLLLHLQE